MSEVDTNNYCLLGLYHSPIPMYLNFFLSKVEITIFFFNLRNPLVRPQPSAMMVRLLLLCPPRCHTTALQGTIYPHGNRMPQSNYLEREGQLKSTRKIFALIREKAITVKRFRQTWQFKGTDWSGARKTIPQILVSGNEEMKDISKIVETGREEGKKKKAMKLLTKCPHSSPLFTECLKQIKQRVVFYIFMSFTDHSITLMICLQRMSCRSSSLEHVLKYSQLGSMRPDLSPTLSDLKTSPLGLSTVVPWQHLR